MAVVKEDMPRADVTEENAGDVATPEEDDNGNMQKHNL